MIASSAIQINIFIFQINFINFSSVPYVTLGKVNMSKKLITIRLWMHQFVCEGMFDESLQHICM